MAAARRGSGSSSSSGTAAGRSKAARQEAPGSQAQADAKPVEFREKDKRWWRLVWCHERCFMPECESRRQSLSEAARASGAALICLKRAARLDRWLTERLTPIRSKKPGTQEDADAKPAPYVLMTDWREVQTCSEAIVKQDPVNHPAFTVLVCEDPHQAELVAPWVQQAPRVMQPVYICTDLGAPDMFLTCLVGRLLGSSAQRAPHSGASSSSSRSPHPRLSLEQPSPSYTSPRQPQPPPAAGGRGPDRQQTPPQEQERKRLPALAEPLEQAQQQQQQLGHTQPRPMWAFAPIGGVPQHIAMAGQELGRVGHAGAASTPGAAIASPTSEVHLASADSMASSAPFAAPVGQLAAEAVASAMPDPAAWAPLALPFSHPVGFHTLEALPRDAVILAPPLSLTTAAAEEQPAEQVLPCGCTSSEELDRLLREAMPEQYEE